MIDLHIHTTYSDGTDNLREILEKCEELKLDIISITDHDTCLAYKELKNESTRKLFSGKIINGIEITSTYKNNRIDVLAYNFDNIDLINDYFMKVSNIDWKPIYKEERLKLLEKFNKLNLKYDESFKHNLYFVTYETKLYKSLLDNNPNLKEVLGDEYCDVDTMFFRKCISNSESKFFINYNKYRPSLKETIDLIHENNGLLFLAHPFNYHLDNVKDFINNLYNEHNLDGIEVAHSYNTEEEIKYLNKFANERKLLKSGGSDYHGTLRGEISLGYLYASDSKIENKLIENW